MKKRLSIVVTIVLLCVMLLAMTPKTTPAQSNLATETVPYAGQLTDAAGQPVLNGQYDLLFELYDASVGGQRLWTETQMGITVTNSQIRTTLGAITPLPANLSKIAGYWLAVSVRGPNDNAFTRLDPRQPFAAAPAPNVVGAGLACPHNHFSDYWNGTSATYGLQIENSGAGDALRVYGNSPNVSNGGLYAYNTGIGYGIMAVSSAGHAIDAQTSGASKSSVYAHTTATGANGVVANSSSGYGVYATSSSGKGMYAYSATGDGLEAITGGTNLSALYAHTVNGFGLTARSTNTFAIQAGGKDTSSTDVYGDILLEGARGEILTYGSELNLTSNGGVNIFLDDDNNGNNWVNDFAIWNGTDNLAFSVTESGNTTATGTKSATVKTADYGQRLLYSVESPEVWLEDFGTAQLNAGIAKVAFESIFAQTINTKAEYHVYLTPLCSEAVLLFVSAKTEQGFTVQGVTLTNQPTNCSFDYRVVAKRLGYENQRLEIDNTPRTKEEQP